MRTVVQRVIRASVTADGRLLGAIGRGLLVLVGITHSDGSAHVRWMCEKLLRLRIFEDDQGKMNLSVTDVGGGILLVSQFTLYADAVKGNRPGFSDAAAPTHALPLYDEMAAVLRISSGLHVVCGEFGARMEVELVNDGPVTIILERP
jgi:D-tyrosyl-tRNA(Tyr) deacylase